MKRNEIAEKYLEQECTLDGNPAKIVGQWLPFAIITPDDYGARSVQFSWNSVKRVMEKHGGSFKS